MAKSFSLLLTMFLALVLLGTDIHAQVTTIRSAVSEKESTLRPKLVTRSHRSQRLDRNVSYRVILPARYEIDRNKQYPVIYLLHGLTGSYTDWSDRTNLAKYLEKYEFIVAMPDGKNGWYTDSATVGGDKAESYIIRDFIPEIERRFRAKRTRESRVIAGLSMGGYGALKFGAKYPDAFVLAGSFSGALQIAEASDQLLKATGWEVLIQSVASVFDHQGSTTRQENDLFQLVRDLDPAGTKLPFFYLDSGTEDLVVTQTQLLAVIMFQKRIPHEVRVLPGRHDWAYWDQQIEEFLEVAQKYVEE